MDDLKAGTLADESAELMADETVAMMAVKLADETAELTADETAVWMAA